MWIAEVVSYVRADVFPWQERLLSLSHKHFVRFGAIPRAAYERELLRALESSTPPPDLDSGIYADHKEFTFLGVFEVEQSGLPEAETLDMAAFAPAFATLIGKQSITYKTINNGWRSGLTRLARLVVKRESRLIPASLKRFCRVP
jgi:hypothetical protein